MCTKSAKKFKSLCDDNLCRKSALVRKSNHSVMTALSEKCVSDRQQVVAKCIMDNDDRPICTELLYYVRSAKLKVQTLRTLYLSQAVLIFSRPFNILFLHINLKTFSWVRHCIIFSQIECQRKGNTEQQFRKSFSRRILALS